MLSVVLGIVLTLAVFLFVVFFHELGHFLAAKFSGVRVEEFGLGIPPRAARLHTDASGTDYTLNWLPIGGFVRMKGEDSLDGEDAPDAFPQATFPRQLAIVLAGVFMNFLLAFLIFFGAFWYGVQPLGMNTRFETETRSLLVPTFDQARESGFVRTGPVKISPLAGSSAEKAWIRAGDELVSVNGEAVDSPKRAVELIRASRGVAVLGLRSMVRGSVTVRIVSVPVADRKIGAAVDYGSIDFDRDFRYEFWFLGAARAAAGETVAQARLTLELLGSLLRDIVAPAVPEDRTRAVESVSGPIGVGGMFVDFVSTSVPFSVILLVTALISVNLGVFNLLPIPALDGARALAILIRAGLSTVFPAARRSGAMLEGYVHIAGFAVLILVSIFVAFHDITVLFR